MLQVLLTSSSSGQSSSLLQGGWHLLPMFVLQMSPPEQSPSPEQEVGPEGSVLHKPLLVSHVPPGHELSPPINPQPGAQIGPAFTLSVRQMLSAPTQSPSELHDLGSHMVVPVLQEVSVKPAAEQSSSYGAKHKHRRTTSDERGSAVLQGKGRAEEGKQAGEGRRGSLEAVYAKAFTWPHGGWQTLPRFVLQMSPPEQSPSPCGQ